MRLGIISDVHSNYIALKTVLENMGSVDALWCLGDIVGYGPQPNECVEAITQSPHLSIPGNHDWGTLGKLDSGSFNRDARAVLEWTRAQLSAESSAYLDALPVMVVPREDEPSCTLVHASPRDPMWEYLIDLFDAAECFPLFNTRYLFVGHTHVPIIFRDMAGIVKVAIPEPGEKIRLNVRPFPRQASAGIDTVKMIINPGSVGQPRDNDPRASYMTLELDDSATEDNWNATLTYQRVEYPVKETQDIMKSLNFPSRLINRLQVGL